MSGLYLDASQWADIRQIVNDFGDDVNKDILIWEKWKGSIPIHGSDQDVPQFELPLQLNCLAQYNVFRTWPITSFVESGSQDKQSILILLNISYLASLNLLDADSKFAYNPQNDRFIFRGQLYYDAGNTGASATDIDPLFYILILKRVDNDSLSPIPV